MPPVTLEWGYILVIITAIAVKLTRKTPSSQKEQVEAGIEEEKEEHPDLISRLKGLSTLK